MWMLFWNHKLLMWKLFGFKIGTNSKDHANEFLFSGPSWHHLLWAWKPDSVLYRLSGFWNDVPFYKCSQDLLSIISVVAQCLHHKNLCLWFSFCSSSGHSKKLVKSCTTFSSKWAVTNMNSSHLELCRQLSLVTIVQLKVLAFGLFAALTCSCASNALQLSNDSFLHFLVPSALWINTDWKKCASYFTATLHGIGDSQKICFSVVQQEYFVLHM